MEHLDLFTPVEQAEMEFPDLYLVLLKSGVVTYGWFQGGWIAGEGGVTLDVTHVLDLSKLTTKEKAKEAISDILSLPNPEIELSYTWEQYDNDVNEISKSL